MAEDYDLLATAFESIKDTDNVQSDFDLVSFLALSRTYLRPQSRKGVTQHFAVHSKGPFINCVRVIG